MSRTAPAYAPGAERSGHIRKRSALNDGWEVRLVSASEGAPYQTLEVPATVPGCVHLDLLAAGLIADPYLDDNEEGQHWIADSVWEYRLEFDFLPVGGDRVDLVFEGLDTVAVVSLNGHRVGATANMHRTHRFDVSSTVEAGVNELTVRFDSPLGHATAEQARLGDLPRALDPPYNFIRKMACNFGWDWGPRLTTSGIWRPVWIETWSGARIAAVRPTATVTPDGGGAVAVDADIERHGGDGEMTLSVSLDGLTVAGSPASAQVEVEVPSVDLWWPVGRGTQRLYSLVVETLVDGVATDRVERMIGFRTVELDTSVEPDGTRFAIMVNGERVWVRGFNWIPDDCFPARVGRDRYERRIADAVEANANLLRVWGGGIYESDDFYEICDRRGLLVWQDFLFACAAYPGELAMEVEAEARDAIDRLMAHPSLVIWNGNNENLWGWWDWGWQPEVGEREWGPLFYRHILPGLVTTLDPARPYIDGSPTSGAGGHPSQRPKPRSNPHLGRVERAGLHPLPELSPSLRRRVRIPGAGQPRHDGQGCLPSAAQPGRCNGVPPPEGRPGHGQAGPGSAGPCRESGRIRTLALPHPADPGGRSADGGRPLPQPPRPMLRIDLVAAQRLLAGGVMVGGGR